MGNLLLGDIYSILYYMISAFLAVSHGRKSVNSCTVFELGKDSGLIH